MDAALSLSQKSTSCIHIPLFEPNHGKEVCEIQIIETQKPIIFYYLLETNERRLTKS
jgi:hypothetical protein